MPSIVVESYSSLPRTQAGPHEGDLQPGDARLVPEDDDHERRPPKSRRKSHGGETRGGKKGRRKSSGGGSAGEKENKKGNGQTRDKRKRYRRMRSKSQSHACPEVRVHDVDEADAMLLPFNSHLNTAEATAR
jgi:hypothetical protein